MCNKLFEIAELGADSKDKCFVIINALDEVMERVPNGETKCVSSQPPREASTTMPSFGEVECYGESRGFQKSSLKSYGSSK